MEVRYLPEEDIESEAEYVLAESARASGIEAVPPIPVEDILEFHLKVHLGFDNLCSELKMDDVLGATWVDTRQVLIDQSLDPDGNPNIEGRYRYTVAHELGHWQLHRQYFATNPAQLTLFSDARPTPSYICRKSQARKRIEWQADRFAAHLTMPRRMVLDAWRDRRGGLEPYILEDEYPSRIAHPFASIFHVSLMAMYIRLENLGLLRDESKPEDLFAYQP